MFRKYLALVCFALLGTGALAGCHTVSGAGQDIQRGGEAVQDSAE